VASADGAASIAVSASDDIAPAVSATYTLTASNVAPTLSLVSALSGGKEDLALAISFADLLASADEADSNGSVVGFEVTAIDSTKGSLTIGGSAWTSSNKLINTDRGAVWTSLLASARDMSEWRQEFRVSRPDGPPRWLLGSSTPQREADGTVVWHGTVQDVTEKHELDAARQAAAVAEAANRAKTVFLSRMSHELRTPLNAVLGFAQLMEIDLAEPPGPTQKRRLALIRQSGEHLLQMIGDLLDLTRIEAGGMALQIEATALAPLAEECVAMLQGQAAAASVSVVLHPPATALAVRADATRLRQVLLNLLGNAIKYNRPGGRAELSWSASEGDRVRVQVTDSGIGVEPEELPRLFEPFYRSVKRRDAVDGAGIGLSVTQALVALMAGQIEVDSQPGQGSVFTVTLPAA
jgi:signal transduction histidine kinase